MSFDYFGSAVNPAHGGTNATSPLAVTPPGSMASGDLVVLIGATKAASTDYAVSTSGGQSWSDLGDFTISTNRSFGIFWCTYNGTWAADPALSVTVGNAFTVAMVVARPTSGHTISFEQVDPADGHAAPSTPFDITMTGITTTHNDAFVIYMLHTVDDSTLVQQSGSTTERISANNVAGTDLALYVGTMTKATAGATGNTVVRETTNGGDVAIDVEASWYSTAAAGGGMTMAIVTGF